MATDLIQSLGSRINYQLEISTYTDYNHSWIVDISLNELHKIILNLITFLCCSNNYNQLCDILIKTRNLIEKILKIFITENNFTCHSIENSCKSDPGKYNFKLTYT